MNNLVSGLLATPNIIILLYCNHYRHPVNQDNDGKLLILLQLQCILTLCMPGSKDDENRGGIELGVTSCSRRYDTTLAVNA